MGGARQRSVALVEPDAQFCPSRLAGSSGAAKESSRWWFQYFYLPIASGFNGKAK
jgi:hypothetical protein